MCSATVFQLINTSPYINTGTNAETFPIQINGLTGSSTTNTLTIEPATTASISATSTGTAVDELIVLNGASNIIITGLSGTNLTLSTAYNGDIPVYITGACTNDQISYCNVEAYSTGTSADPDIYIYSNHGATSTVSVTNCNIHDNTSVGYTSYGIYVGNSKCVIAATNNNI